jgi:RND family efflux transporter MFP subunit
MARRNLSAVIRYLRQLTGSDAASGSSDAELLERYVRQRDEAAFELLLWRHGALVFNVCRRLLPREQDAEDAFQATFLAFVRKAGSISRRGSVASWLYKVAYRVALESRERARKTAAMEQPGGELRAEQPAADPTWSDVRPILDDEVNRLPERLRRPFVLCYLEGKSNEEAARELGCRLGTIYSRLARGREMLRRRLLRRGVTLSVAVLTARAVEATPAGLLLRSTVRAALSFAESSPGAAVSPRVATLAEGVLRAMFVTKLKIAAVMIFVATVLAAGGVLSHGLTAAPQAEAKAENPPPKPKGDDKKDAEPIAVKVVKPKKGGLVQEVTREAFIVAAQQQQLVPLIAGTVKEVSVDIGDRVKKGQTLIVLDAPLLTKEVEEATASLELVQAQVDEAKAIFEFEESKFRRAQGDPPSKSRAALGPAKAKARLAQVLLDKARIQASFTQLKAAFDGVVTRRTADPGNFVQPSDARLLVPLLTVQSFDPLRLVVQLPSEYAPRISRGDPVELTLRNPLFRIGGLKVIRFNSALDPEKKTMRVEIDLPNSDGRLLPGMFGHATIHCQKVPAGTMVIPRSCLNASYGSNFFDAWVYVVRDGKAHLTQVTPGQGSADEVEIVQGIQASDLVITNPDKLENGTRVKFEKHP